MTLSNIDLMTVVVIKTECMIVTVTVTRKVMETLILYSTVCAQLHTLKDIVSLLLSVIRCIVCIRCYLYQLRILGILMIFVIFRILMTLWEERSAPKICCATVHLNILSLDLPILIIRNYC